MFLHLLFRSWILACRVRVSQNRLFRAFFLAGSRRDVRTRPGPVVWAGGGEPRSRPRPPPPPR